MSFYPLLVALIALVFGGAVLAQWTRRRRPQQLVWGVALLLAAAGSFAYVGFLAGGSILLFRLYYICGALLMAAYLGMGSLYLVVPRRWCDLILAGLVIVSAVAVALLLVAPVDSAALRATQHSGGPGEHVLKPGLWLVLLVLHNIFGALAVIGVALYSAYKSFRRQAPGRFALANVVIALGTLIISEAGTAARLGSPALFWVTMAVGWVVIFAGFLLTTSVVPVRAITSGAHIPQETLGQHS